MTATHHEQSEYGQRWGRITFAALHVLAFGAGAGFAEDSTALPISVPAKTIPAPAASTEPMMSSDVPSMTAPTQPSLPDARLPQYQLDSPLTSALTEDPSRQSPLRFQLALPARPIIIEATIQIDGQPFQAARRRRIDRIVQAAQTVVESHEQNVGETLSDSPPGGTEGAEDRQEADENDVSVPATPVDRAASTDEEIASRFFAATGMDASADAVAWLLLTRVDGPPLLMLNNHFQRFRRDQRPAFDVLDTDADESLSQEEIMRAVESLIKCDLNRNDVVDYLEIEQVAESGRILRTPQFDGTTLLQLLPTGHSDDVDIEITVDFNTADPQQSRLRLDAAADGIDVMGTESGPSASGDPSAITVSIDGTVFWFSAIQPGATVATDQVSLGAVDDGYPLLPVLDADDDGRLTTREMRGLVDRIRQLDRDEDGQIAGVELRAPIRVCIGLGPTVHRELAGIRSIGTKRSRAKPGPEWFTRMDRNDDGDLSRKEFPGTDQQFAELDKDGDGLISGDEAFAGEQ